MHIHSVDTVKRSVRLFADKTETRNNVFTCVRTAVDCLRIFSCCRTTLTAHVYASNYDALLTLFTQRALKIDCPVHCIGWPRWKSRYKPPSHALQFSFEFGSVFVCKPWNWTKMLSQTCLAFTNAIRPSFGGEALNMCKIICHNRALFFVVHLTNSAKISQHLYQARRFRP